MTIGALAWDEWKKNSLVLHAQAYPEIWYGIWSGPDSYNSALSKHPGSPDAPIRFTGESEPGKPLRWAVK